MELVFSCRDLCCNARKWWQWLALKWNGFISTKMGTASWGTLCCSCTPHAASAFQMHPSSSFHVKIYFQGKTTHVHIEFTMKNMFALLWGAWVLCPGLQSKNTNEIEGSVKLCMIHLYPDLQLAVIHNSGCECLCLSKVEHSSQFPQTEARGENIPSPLIWHLPFWVRVCPFSPENPTNFVTGTSCGWLVEGMWGSPMASMVTGALSAAGVDLQQFI